MSPAPAQAAPAPGEESVLPVVARPASGVPMWMIVAVAVLAAILLFVVLDGRRRALTAPAVEPPRVDAISTSAPPPTLYIPPEPVFTGPAELIAPAPVLTVPPSPATPAPLPPAQTPAYIPPSQPAPSPVAPVTPRRITADPGLVIDTTAPRAGSEAAAQAAPPAPEDGPSVAGSRAGAGVLANRATSVPQGTLIPAVLETALDSTRPGLARAIVSRDIRSFDGSRVLIPRGSRLIGEYGAQAEAGQKRMLVNWIRLIRPDGATIAIGSPAGDTLGRAGIRANVNSHFFERFAGAFLQSALDIGVNLAARRSDSPVIVALPGSLQGATVRTDTGSRVRPTLTVKPATSISIFVARDLDFTAVEAR